MLSVLLPNGCVLMQLPVAFFANIRGAMIALRTMKSGLFGRYLAFAKITACCDRQGTILASGSRVAWWEWLDHAWIRRRRKRGLDALIQITLATLLSLAVGPCEWQQRMSTASALIDAVLAKAPFALVALVALVEEIICILVT